MSVIGDVLGWILGAILFLVILGFYVAMWAPLLAPAKATAVPVAAPEPAPEAYVAAWPFDTFPALAPDPTALYRAYGADGNAAPLYIGVSKHPLYRWQQHARLKPWWNEDVESLSVVWFETRGEALRAEAAAIHAEDPVHNVVHKPYRWVPDAPTQKDMEAAS